MPVNTTTGTSPSEGVSRSRSRYLEAGHIRETKVEHHAVERLLAERVQRLTTAGDHGDIDVVIAEQLPNA